MWKGKKLHEEESHAKFLENIFNQTREENFQNLEKGKPIHIKEAHQTGSEKEISSYIIVRWSKAHNKENIQKPAKEKGQVTIKSSPNRIMPCFNWNH